ncbi:uncharacterized protein CC84DRAFT_1173548 [Paraphaeosphaeria sporulosa]|uniref:Uncharacterized protein n=1 Tax=Paraphaeosphaeria sporulosa TaxID=1460663 RepID=A0A177CKA5_9PLEO|nr:uncharacterized protein CC84DRAFT_1173548 [Paraphaeosphaeria sporulosa]OAG07964.1 hypothetical protein CC84DRAFT_1173548 [Paraphaeosphaeria sporulosa]
MPPKRKRAEPEEQDEEHRKPTYASEVDWLACLTDPSRDVSTSTEIAKEETNTALITAACKLTYVLYHNVQAQECLATILQSLNKSGTEDDAELTRVAKSSQSAWKAHVVNKFLIPHVKEIVRKWCVARPYKNFGSLPASDRIQLWFKVYDYDPKSTVVSMWKPVIGVLDLGLIFRTDLPPEDDVKMKAVRQMLRHKYYFGCECTYKYSVADPKKAEKSKTLQDWASYAKYSDYASGIVPFADMPISPKTLAIYPSEAPAKKTKVTLADGAFGGASLNSAIDNSDAAIVASEISDNSSARCHNTGVTSSFQSSLPNSRTISREPSLSALMEQEKPTEPLTYLQELINGPSSGAGLARQGGQGAACLTKGFAGTKGLLVFQPTPKPTPRPKAPMTEAERGFNEFFGVPNQASIAAPMILEASSPAAAPEPEVDEDLL